jgi:hypothetical protein
MTAKVPDGYVHVQARNASIAKVLSHPADGGFDEEHEAYWRKDAFTLRRIADGDVKELEPASGAEERAAEAPVEGSDAPRSRGRIR